MIYIFCALKCEASPLIRSLSLTPSKTNRKLYKGDGIELHITGVGKLNVSKMLSAFSPLPGSHLINAGTCGCMDTDIHIGTAFLVNEIWEHDGGIPHYPDMLVNTTLSEAGCTTYDSPNESKDCPTLLADCECHAFYKSCLKITSSDRIHVLKVVSDHMDTKSLTKNDLSQAMHKASGHITEYIEQLMSDSEEQTRTDYTPYYEKYRFTAAMRTELSKLNRYHELRYGKVPNTLIYEAYSTPTGKKDSMRIFNDIREKLI